MSTKSVLRAEFATILLVVLGESATMGQSLYVRDSHERVYRTEVGSGETQWNTGELVDSPFCVGVDIVSQSLYWSDREVRAIFRANLDGSGARPIWFYIDNIEPDYLSIDSQQGKIYWADNG